MAHVGFYTVRVEVVPPPGVTCDAADLSNLNDTVKAVSGCRIAFLVAGLKYDLKVWRELWPRIMHNAIEACKRSMF
jgi:hypothetical protein